MARIIREKIEAHKSIYTKAPEKREIEIEYSIPENGENSDTGILVIVPGYGGNLNSNVYRHIREDFPDKYNYIVVQCDYFGSRFMQGTQMEWDETSAIAHSCDSEGYINWTEKLDESINDFNDMGMMQALDVVTSVMHIISKVETVNTEKIVLFGTSHGAYLGHLANIICPFLFKYLLDISGYMYPYYLSNNRMLLTDYGNNRKSKVTFRYLVQQDRSCRYDNRFYDLRNLYALTDNTCRIICVQGTEDWMVNAKEKELFINSISNSEYIEFGEEDTDGEVFKNASHGLGLDYIKYLDMVIPMLETNLAINNVLQVTDSVEVGEYLKISYKNLYPEIEYISFGD